MKLIRSQLSAWSLVLLLGVIMGFLAYQLDQANKIKEELDNKNKELESNVQKEKEKNVLLLEEIDELNEDVEEKEGTISEQKEQIKKIKNDLKKTEKELSEKEKTIKNKDNEIKRLKQVETQIKNEEVTNVVNVSNKQAKGKTMQMRVTYYTSKCTGCTGRTASGYKLSDGQTTVNGYRVVAADTSILPLHSIIRITNPDGSSYKAIVLDRGGAIKGNRLDILTASKDEAFKNGTHNVTIEVISYGDNKYRKAG